MTEGNSTPPSQTLTRRLRSLIANLGAASVESTAKQICGWIDSFKDRNDYFRGLTRLSAELVLEKAMERPDQDLHHVLARLCNMLDTATDGKYSEFLNPLLTKEVEVAGAEFLENSTAEAGSWPEYLALVVFVGELCDAALLRPDALHSCVRVLGNIRSNLGLELACALLEATEYALCEDNDGKKCFDIAIQTMLSASRGDGISTPVRHRVQELAAQWASGWAPPSRESVDDVRWDDETVNLDAGEERPETQTSSYLCGSRHPKFYFRSGDVIFVCEDRLFRIHSDLLSNGSQVFSDLLERARLNGGHLSDGCPCVHLSDAVEDFVTLLKVFYTTGFPHRHETSDFTTFSSLLRMTTKYQFPRIRSQILLDLLPAYPTRLSKYEKSSRRGEAVFGTPLPHPNSVLSLFVTCDVAFALPFAYYRACVAGDPASLDTSVEDLALPPDTLKAALRGQARLKTDEVQLARKVAFRHCTSWQCSGKSPENRVRVFNWIHPEVVTQSGILERGDFNGPKYCSQCSQAFAQGLSKAKKDIWENLPSYFNLPPWETTVDTL